MKRWRVWSLLILLASFLAAAPTPVARAAEPLCFSEPGIVNCISDPFREYWERAGGLRQFGYPLTSQTLEATEAGLLTVQYFERARFEYHPFNPPEYQVLLGRLGAELFGPPFPFREEPRAGCRYFDATGFNVCEPFVSAWEQAGATPGAGSMELYGLPLTPVLAGFDTEGRPISLQWFERTRMELHGSSLVLFGLLGREYLEGPVNEEPPLPEEPPPPPPDIPPPPPEPTLPAPLEAPFPDRPCHINVPAPVEGLQVWATMPVVGPPYDQVICIRLIVGGEVAHGAFGQVFRYTPAGIIPSIQHATGLDGTASYIFYVGNIPDNTTVPVEAIVTFAGREYRAWTSFVKR